MLSLSQHNAFGYRLTNLPRVHAMVNLVDAVRFSDSMRPHFRRAPRRSHLLMSDPQQSSHELLHRRIEGSDLVLLNKPDQIGADERELLLATLGARNPQAEIAACAFADYPVDQLLHPSRQATPRRSRPTPA